MASQSIAVETWQIILRYAISVPGMLSLPMERGVGEVDIGISSVLRG